MKGRLCRILVLLICWGSLTACSVDVLPAPPRQPTTATSQGTIIPAAHTSQVAPPTVEARIPQDPWAQVRAALGSSTAIYRPRSLPARFGSPELVEVEAAGENSPRYTVVYKADGELMAFIMGMGAGALGNAPIPVTEQSVSILGQDGTLFTNEKVHPPFLGASWQQGGHVYDVTAMSTRMTIEEFRQILDNLEEVR